jgi:hypothetical protein
VGRLTAGEHRAIVLHEKEVRNFMNVTVKLPADLVAEARHRAIARSQSLSQWVADLLRREIAREHPDRKTLAERLGDPATAQRDFELPDRKNDRERPIAFP